MMVSENDNENKNDTTSVSSVVNNTTSSSSAIHNTTDNQHEAGSVSTDSSNADSSSDANVNNVSNTTTNTDGKTDNDADNKTSSMSDTDTSASSVSEDDSASASDSDTTMVSDSDSTNLLTTVNNNDNDNAGDTVMSDDSASTADSVNTTNSDSDASGSDDADTASRADLSVDSDSDSGDLDSAGNDDTTSADNAVSSDDTVSNVNTSSSSDSDTSSVSSSSIEGQFVGVGSAHVHRSNKHHHNNCKRACTSSVNTTKSGNDATSTRSIKQTVSDNSVEQPGWIYWLMVFIAIISVFSIMYGSYNLHEKQNLDNTIMVIYDSQSDSWHVDPMHGWLSITAVDSNTGNDTTSTISEFKQFKSSDMRIFTKMDASKNSMSNWRSQNPSKYKFTDGDIASMRCKEPKLNDDNSIACSGSAIISITGNDKPLVNYIRQHEIPGHEND